MCVCWFCQGCSLTLLLVYLSHGFPQHLAACTAPVVYRMLSLHSQLRADFKTVSNSGPNSTAVAPRQQQLLPRISGSCTTAVLSPS